MTWPIVTAAFSTALCAALAMVFRGFAENASQWHCSRKWSIAYAFFALVFATQTVRLLPVALPDGPLAAILYSSIAFAFTYTYLGLRDWRGLVPVDRPAIMIAVGASLVFFAAFLLPEAQTMFGAVLATLAVFAYPLLCIQAILVSKKRLNAGHRFAVLSLSLLPLAVLADALRLSLQGGGFDVTAAVNTAFASPDAAVINTIVFPAACLGAAVFYLLGMLIELAAKVRESSLRDPLTRLYNRQGFSEHAGLVHDHARRDGVTYAVIACHVEELEAVDKTYGREASERVLRFIADQLRKHAVKHQVTARSGSDEFLLLLPDTDKLGACELAEKLRATVASTPIILAARKKAVRVALSFGVAVNRGGENSLAQVVRSADEALTDAASRSRGKVAFMPSRR